MTQKQKIIERFKKHLINFHNWKVKEAGDFEHEKLQNCIDQDLDECDCYREVFNEPCGYFVSDENGKKYL